MAEEVSVRELKARLSHYLARVQKGERIVVTSRGKKVAVLNPSVPDEVPAEVRRQLEAGIIERLGGSMRDLPPPIPLLPGDKTMVDYVREQRR